MDGLSTLPDALLCHILSFMPVQDVVRTSVLSRRWKSLWISAPDLNIDLISGDSHSYQDFILFVNRALLFRGGKKIRRFKIKLNWNPDYQKDLDLWVRYALQNDVEELFLDLVGGGIVYELPQFLSSCSSIKIMKLEKCSMPYDEQISWPSLKSLSLSHVFLYGEVLRKVLSGSPNLEFLELSNCSNFYGRSTNSACLKKLTINLTSPSPLRLTPVFVSSRILLVGPVLRISAPNVTHLYLSGDLHRRRLQINASSLEHAAIGFSGKLDNEERFENYLQVLASIDHVKNLTLGTFLIKVLAVKEKKGLPSPPSKRERLTLITPTDQEDLLGILHLLKCSPNLEKLALHMASSPPQQLLNRSEFGRSAGFCNLGGENYFTSQENTMNWLLPYLKVVNITNFVDDKSVFLLIELLLKKAKVLERIAIRPKKAASSSSEPLLHSALKLLAMPRLSPGAVVTFLD